MRVRFTMFIYYCTRKLGADMERHEGGCLVILGNVWSKEVDRDWEESG